MKTNLILMLLAFLSLPSFAQKIIEKKLPFRQGQTANLNLKFADSIRVRYWDKPEVYIKITAVINGNRLNDALIVQEMTNEQEVGVEISLDQELAKAGVASDCPDNKKGSWNSKDGNKTYYFCKEINYQVFLPRNARLEMQSIDGNIDIEGGNVPVSVKTISGYVDMTWPNGKGANLAMKTITGEVYSNLDIDLKNKKEKHPIVGYLLEGTVNGGGPVVRLESISNNVYLRRRD